MLSESFIFLDKVGKKTEQNIWQQEIPDWERFRAKKHVRGFSQLRKGYYDRQLEKAQQAMQPFDIAFFTQRFPSSETWRLYAALKDEAVFLDIETSGYYGDITVIGLYDGEETKTMVQGYNLGRELLKHELSRYKLILTFNGGSFDLPVIRRYFHFTPHAVHIDLRFVCQRIGLTGGLKAIERKIGIRRAKEIEEITGADAVYLWNMWKLKRKRKHLDLLLQYNEQDVLHLQPLAEMAIARLWEQTRNTKI